MPYTWCSMSLLRWSCEFHSCLLKGDSRAPTVAAVENFAGWRQFLGRGAEAVSHGLADHRTSPVSLRQGDRRPCCEGRASSSCAVVEVTAATASCGMKLAQGAGRALCTGTGPGFTPAMWAEKEWRGRQEFLPG